MTDNQLLARDAILNELPDEYDTESGSVFWNIASAIAVPLGEMMDTIENAIAQKDPMVMSGEDLDTFVSGYGLVRESGAEASASLTVVLDADTTAVNIPEGTLFETENGIQFAAIQNYDSVVDRQTINVEAVGIGSQYNVDSDTITVIPVALDGVESVFNTDPAYGGKDEESDGDLFERWQIQIGYIQTGYNRAWYEASALNLDEIGYAKAYAAGESIGDEIVPNNYVYLVVLDTMKAPLDDETLTSVQRVIDPDIGGIGDGIAPPTAHCMVISGTVLTLSVSIEKLSIESSAVADVVKADITDILQQMVQDIEVGGMIRLSDVLAGIKAVEGVVDVDVLGLTMNDSAENIQLAYNQSVTLGGITYGSITSI